MPQKNILTRNPVVFFLNFVFCDDFPFPLGEPKVVRVWE